MTASAGAPLIVSTVVVIVGIALVVFRRPLSGLFDWLLPVSNRSGSGNAVLPTTPRIFEWAGAAVTVRAVANVGWPLTR